MNPDDSNARRFHVGSTIAGRYRVERPIGEGAMGAVALARHVTLDETVAIKFLPPELRRDPVANARLSREAKALARIKSDHVARVLDVGTTLSVGPYMVMEYLEGIDLGDVLETEGPLPVARAVECVLQVCEALAVAHTAGITHRDIKPQNLFLARHGQFETLKILDFGIAEDTRPAGTSSGEPSSNAGLDASALDAAARSSAPVYGTPSYMAPERVRNDHDADHRSDIWSVGVVLHELVTGRALFDASSITETCALIVSNEPIPLERNDAALPRSLRSIIARCLERDPDRRYQSVEELAAALAPLATMHERFRGRSTGAFSRRLLEAELAQRGKTSEARLAPSPLSPLAAALRRAIERLRQRSVLTYLVLAAASAFALLLGARWIDDVRWMAPPPKVGAPIRAEPAASRSQSSKSPSVAAPHALSESILPLAPVSSSEPVGSAVVSEPVDSSSDTAREAGTEPAGVTKGRAPAPSRTASTRTTPKATDPSRAKTPAVKPSDAARSAVPAKKERGKRARPVPASGQTHESRSE
jgi:serine/threonine protein kinase